MKLLQKILILSAVILFTVFTTVQAQEKEKFAESITAKLQQKVLLNADQAAKVKSIVTDYIDASDRNAKISQSQKDVSALLDKRQQAKYDIIKDDWWGDINRFAAKQEAKK